MTNTQLPVACSLTPPELQQRRTQLLKKIGGGILETKELENGFAYRFATNETWITELAQLIMFERQCCPFLTIDLRLEPANGPIWLELSGPEGTKQFLSELLS